MNRLSSLASNLQKIRDQISQRAQQSGRSPSDITLVAVSKAKPAGLIREACLAGQHDIGENYSQEFLVKWRECADCPIRWHFVGHLQRRKVRDVVGRVELIHSLNSYPLALVISEQAKKMDLIQKCLIQVNVSGEKTKVGIETAQTVSFLKEINPLENVEVIGLMTLPPYFEDREKVRPFFRQLRALRDQLNKEKLYRTELKELSMGMSHDFEVAIEEGATLIRLGTAIFGER